MEAADLLKLLLGGGAVATFTAVFKGIQALQTGARRRERDTVKSLVEHRNEAWADRDYWQDMADHWMQWAGTVEYEARSAGVRLPNRPPEPQRKEKPEQHND